MLVYKQKGTVECLSRCNLTIHAPMNACMRAFVRACMRYAHIHLALYEHDFHQQRPLVMRVGVTGVDGENARATRYRGDHLQDGHRRRLTTVINAREASGRFGARRADRGPPPPPRGHYLGTTTEWTRWSPQSRAWRWPPSCSRWSPVRRRLSRLCRVCPAERYGPGDEGAGGRGGGVCGEGTGGVQPAPRSGRGRYKYG